MDSTTVNQTATFLDQLRAATSESHKDLEKLPLSTVLLSPQLSNEDYAKYLKAMYDVVHETENRIFPIVKDLFSDLNERKKSSLLDQDLAALQTSSAIFEAPFKAMPMLSLPFALGIFYVVEGSTLGGRFILKNIQSTLGFDENHGAQYFAGYGNKTGSFWKNFLNILTDYEQKHDAADDIIAGANYAFTSIHNHFLAQS